ncbi:hypothetical protein RS87_14110 [Bacillus safensis FO-36b]|nr:hypothetical protein RS87_14110 [Bacillus safensis FO-36b]
MSPTRLLVFITIAFVLAIGSWKTDSFDSEEETALVFSGLNNDRVLNTARDIVITLNDFFID